MARKAKERKVRRPGSKFGRFVAELVARPGQGPVFDDVEPVAKVENVIEPKFKVQELKKAAELVNQAASVAQCASCSKDSEEDEIEEEFKEEFADALAAVEDHTSKWKATGETGLYIEPRVTLKDHVEKIVSKYKAERAERDKKNWVKVEDVKQQRKSVFRMPALFRREKKKVWVKPSEEKVSDVFGEVIERVKSVEKEKSRSREDIDKIYKQLSDK